MVVRRAALVKRITARISRSERSRSPQTRGGILILSRCLSVALLFVAWTATAEEPTPSTKAEALKKFLTAQICDTESFFLQLYVMCRAGHATESESLQCYREAHSGFTQNIKATASNEVRDKKSNAITADSLVKVSEAAGSLANLWLRRHRNEIDRTVLELRELGEQRAMEDVAKTFGKLAEKECLREMETAQRDSPTEQ